MATQAHCAYCFETLAAKLERRTPLTLRQVEQLWKQYNADPSAADPNAPEDDDAEDLDDSVASPAATSSDSYRPAAISRLVPPSPSSRSSSSAQSALSTPSGLSEASSTTSKNSSRSSIFSLGNRLRREEKQRSEEGSPLFVTWNTLGKGEKRLRGCIGTFEAQELEEGLRSYALTSAFDDTRFHPIAHRELHSLECAVTLLTDFEPVANPMDWAIGTHGLRISFTHHNRRYGSTYLPDVAREQGWTKEETMVSLMRKSGWTGRKDDWSKVELNVVRYQGQPARLDYKAWKEWRDWVDEGEE